ncbi:S1C family serine protease [Leptospira interrogans]|uniref:Serine protease n=1 Tax=Leptospira interrogans serogroup Icterohaemorrhagiae serovar Lai (strain 56601) TaxID=189518 RepID=Q8EXN1_LEPIN|nr:S1C family serine protease [Leptospira interrogans]AAN51736.1 putative serine protease [Leptospira interrogans serovar Lai str. 56601]AER04388.1 putative serine protease [Leptospira interrogans serovar Lai str. IPAV]
MTAILSFSFRIWNKIFFKKANRFFSLGFILFIQPGIYAVENPLPFDELRKGVVQIRVYSQAVNPFTPWTTDAVRAGSGTGFLIGNKRILTNAHVVSNAKFVQVQRYNQTEWYGVKILHLAHDCDLAVLEAENPEFYKDSRDLQLGEIPELNSPLIVVGYPIGGNKVSVTRGIVSRKDQSVYSHSAVDSHLVLQVDAAINPGNSGGPAIQDDKVVGVAFQVATKGENIGYLIPTNVIRHFLKDIEDGKYDGYVELGVRTLNSFNVFLRKAKGIPDHLEGVFVSKVLKNGSAENHLKEGDFLLEIDGQPIGKNGTVMQDKDARVDFVEIVDNKHAGDKISFKLYREGKEISVSFPARRMSDFDFMRNQYDRSYDFEMIGGLLFQEMSRDLITSWGRSGNTSGGSQLLYRFFYFIEDGLNRTKKTDVVLYRKLSHPVNSSSDYFVNMILESVNGIPVGELKDLKKILKESRDRYLRLKFLDIQVPLILNREEAEKADEKIRKIYGLE